MKDGFKNFLRKHRDSIIFGGCISVMAIIMLMPLWIDNDKEDTPMESTSDKIIKAESFYYKGHQYLLFSTGSRHGPSGILHDPDCTKCKLASK